jgi:natural product precursor
MKVIKKLKLTTLSKNELEGKQMKPLTGGYTTNDNCDDPGCCMGDSCNCGSISPLNSDSSSFWRWV